MDNRNHHQAKPAKPNQADIKIPHGTHCELCGMVAETSLRDQYGITHYYCSHHDPHRSHGHKTLTHHEHRNHDKHAGHSVNMFKQKFWVSLGLTIPVLLYSSMLQEWLGFSMPVFAGSDWIPFIFGSAVFWYGGLVFIKSAIAEISAKQPGMMTLISMAIVIAYGYSVINVLFLHGMDFFWDLSTLIVIMLLGHWLEMNSVSGAQNALQELAKLLPDTAELVEGSQSREVPVSKLAAGSMIRVRPGAKVAADGEVVEGSSSVNEAMVTGESLPVKKNKGDKVIAGTINSDGSLLVRVTKVGEHTALAGIMRLVTEAQASKSNTQLLADKAAGWLFYVALVAGLTTLLGWILLANAEMSFTFERVVTVFIIACPHALGLAVPLVTSISTSMAASNGLLVRDRKALESAKDIDVVLFDKTGTLTMGEQGVTDIWTAEGTSEQKLIATAAALEHNSEHIIGKAIIRYATEKKASLPPVKRFKALAGLGVSGEIEGELLMVGGPQLLKKQPVKVVAELSSFSDAAGEQGKTVVYVITGKKLLGAIALADAIRDESRRAIAQLQEQGLRVAMLTGDSRKVAEYVANELNITEYFAEVLPEHKADKVKALQQDGSRVAMVGDGVNDAPALTQADIGIAIGAGTDVAIESAGIVLIKNNPLDVAKIVALSKVTYRKMIQNLWWGAGYNVLSIPLAAGILAPWGFILPPAVGAIIMSLSTIVVAANAQLLRRTSLAA